MSSSTAAQKKLESQTQQRKIFTSETSPSISVLVKNDQRNCRRNLVDKKNEKDHKNGTLDSVATVLHERDELEQRGQRSAVAEGKPLRHTNPACPVSRSSQSQRSPNEHVSLSPLHRHWKKLDKNILAPFLSDRFSSPVQKGPAPSGIDKTRKALKAIIKLLQERNESEDLSLSDKLSSLFEALKINSSAHKVLEATGEEDGICRYYEDRNKSSEASNDQGGQQASRRREADLSYKLADLDLNSSNKTVDSQSNGQPVGSCVPRTDNGNNTGVTYLEARIHEASMAAGSLDGLKPLNAKVHDSSLDITLIDDTVGVSEEDLDEMVVAVIEQVWREPGYRATTAKLCGNIIKNELSDHGSSRFLSSLSHWCSWVMGNMVDVDSVQWESLMEFIQELVKDPKLLQPVGLTFYSLGNCLNEKDMAIGPRSGSTNQLPAESKTEDKVLEPMSDSRVIVKDVVDTEDDADFKDILQGYTSGCRELVAQALKDTSEMETDAVNKAVGCIIERVWMETDHYTEAATLCAHIIQSQLKDRGRSEFLLILTYWCGWVIEDEKCLKPLDMPHWAQFVCFILETLVLTDLCDGQVTRLVSLAFDALTISTRHKCIELLTDKLPKYVPILEQADKDKTEALLEIIADM